MRPLLLVIFAVLLAASRAEAADPAAPRSWQFGDYRLAVERTVGDDPFEQDLLTIRRGPSLLHAEVAAHIGFVTVAEPDAPLPAVVPVTAPAAKDIVVTSYSGGAHCCFTIEILTLGERFQASPPLDTRDAGAALVKLAGRQVYGLRSADETFNYRFSSFVDSPHPEIVIGYDRERGYALDIDQMRRPPMAPDALLAAAQKIRDDGEAWQLPLDFLPGGYLGPLFAMIYSGDMAGAREFAKAAWPAGKPGLAAFQADLFDCALPESPWWPAVAELNGIKAYERGAKCKPMP